MKASLVVLPGLAALLVLACSDPTSPTEEIGGVVVHTPGPELRVGASVQLHATILSRSGTAMNGGRVTWSSDSDAATVSASGLVTGVTTGTARIHATAGEFTGSVDLQVLPTLCSAEDAPTIALGQTRSGTIDASSVCEFIASYGAQVRAQAWHFELPAQTILEILVAAAGVAMDIVVTDRQGNIAVRGSGLSEARLLAPLEQGAWVVWIINWDNAAFSYELSVEQGPPACTPASVEPIAIGDVVSGSMRDGECLFESWIPARGWRLDLEEQTRILARLSASLEYGLDIVLTDDAMNYITHGWGTPDGVQLARTLAPGRYVLWAVSFDADEFELSLLAGEPVCATADTIHVGTVETGRLEAPDCEYDDGRLVDGWTLTLADPTAVAIEMGSTDFDSYLILEDSTGLEIAWDDDGGGFPNARLQVDLLAGRYVVRATSYAPGQWGDYTLSAQAVAAAPPLTASSLRPDEAAKLREHAGQRFAHPGPVRHAPPQ